MPFVTSKNPQIPVPPTPSDRSVHRLSLRSGLLMATPPRGRKMTPERPCPALIETGKSHPKTGLCPVVSRWFPGGLPEVCRRFGAALPPPPGPLCGGGPGGHHVKERWWFRRTGGQPATQDLAGALNRLTAPHVNTPPRSMAGSSAGAYQNPIHPSIMAARLCPLDVIEVVRTARPTGRFLLT